VIATTLTVIAIASRAGRAGLAIVAVAAPAIAAAHSQLPLATALAVGALAVALYAMRRPRAGDRPSEGRPPQARIPN
jgi:hypothetical protein